MVKVSVYSGDDAACDARSLVLRPGIWPETPRIS